MKPEHNEGALVNLETYYSFPNTHDEKNVFRCFPGFVEVTDGDNSSRQRRLFEIKFQKALMTSLILQKQLKIQ